MQVLLTGSVTEPFLTSKISVISELAEALNVHFKTKDYGSSVQEMIIDLIMVIDRPGYEAFFKARRPKYDDKDIKSRLTGETLQPRKTLTIEVKFSEEIIQMYANSTPDKAKLIVMKMVSTHLKSISNLPARASDFMLNDFITDLDTFALALDTSE